MNPLCLLSLLLPGFLLFSSPGVAQQSNEWSWEWVYPSFVGNPLHMSVMFDSTSGWMSTVNGPVYYTTDGGHEWQTGNSGYGVRNVIPVDRELLYGTPVNSQATYCISRDSGHTWEIVVINGIGAFSDLVFVDRQYGWGAEEKTGWIYRTTDGGGTWKRFGTAQNVTDLAPLNRDTILYTDYLGLWRTTDGGTEWERMGYTKGNLYFPSSRLGWLARDVLYRTTDAGATWQQTEVVTGHTSPWMQFADSLNGYFGYYSTSDGGETWKKDVTSGFRPRNQSTFSFPPRSRWYLEASYARTIQRFDIVDRHLDTLHQAPAARIVDMDVDGYSMAVLFSSDSLLTDTLLWHSDDGGHSWRKLVIEPGSYYWTKVALQGDTIWVIDSARVLMSQDAGVSWRMVFENVIDNLQDIALKDGTSGAVISDGDLMLFENEGRSWKILEEISQRPSSYTGLWSFVSLVYHTQKSGYIIDRTLPRYYTLDGGETWYESDTDGPEGTGFPEFITESLGIAGGDETLWITEDAGRNWGQHRISGLRGSSHIQMFDRSTGVALNTAGQLFSTLDRGETWEEIMRGPGYYSTSLSYYPFQCTSPDTCWAMNPYGLVRITSGRVLNVPPDNGKSGMVGPSARLDGTGDWIVVSLEGAADVTVELRISDLLGRHIAELTDRSGTATRLFDVRSLNLSPGTYAVGITAGSRISGILLQKK